MCSPSHECDVCHEDAEERGEAIGCRRCPKSYHRGCLPDALYNAPNRRVWISNRELRAWHCSPSLLRRAPQLVSATEHPVLEMRNASCVEKCLLYSATLDTTCAFAVLPCSHMSKSECMSYLYHVLVLAAEEMVILSDGAVECHLERSLVYCLAHPIAAGDESPLHARPLFRRALLGTHSSAAALGHAVGQCYRCTSRLLQHTLLHGCHTALPGLCKSTLSCLLVLTSH